MGKLKFCKKIVYIDFFYKNNLKMLKEVTVERKVIYNCCNISFGRFFHNWAAVGTAKVLLKKI